MPWGLARVVRLSALADMQRSTDKPSWVEALEESLLLAIGLFSLITWIVSLGLLSH